MADQKPRDQRSDLQSPAAPQQQPGYPQNFQPIIFDGFEGLNTKPTRPAIEDQQCFWLDNWMPLGKSNLRTLYDIGAPIFLAPIVATTWNPSDKTNIDLSNVNLTADAVAGIAVPTPAPYVGPLDLTATSAVVAYGQRAMSAAKRGTTVYTIRRDSDDTTQSFSSDATTGAAPVAAIAAFIGAGNGFVATWADQSGNDLSVSQVLAATAPQWVANSAGGKPALYTNSTTPELRTASTHALVLNTGITEFFVCSLTGAFSTAVSLTYGVSDYLNLYTQPDFIEMSSATTDSDFPGPAPAGFAIIECVVADNGALSLFINGASCLLEGDLTIPLIGEDCFPVIIGANGKAEWIAYNAALSAPDRLAIRTNIAAYYGITL